MNTYTFITEEIPKCKTCGKTMKEWNFFAEEHEHVECAAKRIADSLIDMIDLKLK